MPRVTVYLTSFNHAGYIAASIESILDQTFTDFELYIVDDGSSDNSWEIIQKYTDPRITAIRHEQNEADIFNRNIVSQFRGEYFAIAHCDDLWAPDKLEKQVAFLDGHPGIGACFTKVRLIDENNVLLDEKSAEHFGGLFEAENRSRFEWLHTFFVTGNKLCHPSCMMPMSILRDEKNRVVGMSALPDFYRWVKLCMKHEIYILPERLTTFRVHRDRSNASGKNPVNLKRYQLDDFLVMEQFYSIPEEDFLKVFPEAEIYCRDGRIDTEFALSMLMLESRKREMQLLGVQHMFYLLNDDDKKDELREKYGYTPAIHKQRINQFDVFGELRENDFTDTTLFFFRNGAVVKTLSERVFRRDGGFVVRFSLEGTEFDMLRFDPGEGEYCSFTDMEALIDGKKAEIRPSGDDYVISDNEVRFYTMDPQFEIRPPKGGGSMIRISGRIADMGHAEVQRYLNEHRGGEKKTSLLKKLRKH